ncbi:MAG: cyclic nucleotide-binding domain-containing protein [Pseudomonadota bacterium]
MEKMLEPHKDVIEALKQSTILSEEKRRHIRFEHNLSKFMQSDVQILKSDEFIMGLIAYLSGNTAQDEDRKRKLLINLGQAVISEDKNIRERTLAVLSFASEFFLQTGGKNEILLVVHSFCNWLEYEKEILPGLVVVIKRMEELTFWLLENACWNEGEKLIAIFRLVRDGVIGKGAAFRSLVSQTFDKFSNQATFELLTDGFLLGDRNQHLFRNILLFFQTGAVVYLLNRVIRSLSRKERLSLIHLISSFGLIALPILEECLKNKHSWAVVRNVLCILSEIGSDSCYTFIQQFFGHEDKRVQYEMICCVVKIGGPQIKNQLLHGLRVVDDDLKIYIIQLLVEHVAGDEAVVGVFYQLIEKINTIFSGSKNQLVSAVIAALKSFPCIKSIEILRNLQDDYKKRSGSEQMLLQIEEALQYLIPQLRHHQQRFEESQETVSFESDPQQKQKSLAKLTDIEESLRKFVQTGDMRSVGLLIHDEALSAARAKDMFLAEKLRDRLLVINPMALGEVMALGDLIEEERAVSHVNHHLGVWNELYKEMNAEEFNALHSALRHEKYGKGDIIVRAGDTDDVLYFLKSGDVSLNCLSGGNEIFLKRLGPGSILGGDHFFSASIWTVTLRALSDVHMQVLDHKVFLEIAEKYQVVAEVLRQYSLNYAGVPDLIKISGDERREYPRFPVTLFSKNDLLDPYGKKGKRSLKGELVDISRNGLAFIVKISSQSNAKLMLGRQIISEIQAAENVVLAECYGVIVGIQYQDGGKETSIVRVKFSKKIEDGTFSRILSLGRG